MVPGKHVVPWRHPPQTHCLFIMSHVSPFATHETHVVPPPPQALSAVPGLHVLPLQQPIPHETMSQTHVPVLP